MVVIMSQVTCLIINRFLCFLMVSRAISCYPMLSHDISCNLLESHGDSGCNTIQHAINAFKVFINALYGTSTRELRNTSMTLVPSLKDLCLKKVVKDNVKNYEDLPTVPT